MMFADMIRTDLIAAWMQNMYSVQYLQIRFIYLQIVSCADCAAEVLPVGDLLIQHHQRVYRLSRGTAVVRFMAYKFVPKFDIRYTSGKKLIAAITPNMPQIHPRLG